MERIEIFTMKTFNRLRNKAQLFSSLADDHYHTRLMHSLEVESIALEIVRRLKSGSKSQKIRMIDEELVSNIALLHDIGHTPYGHIGERTLHGICSGKIRMNEIPNFKSLKLSCGFKHNINSGLLYKEYLFMSGKTKSTVFECKVVEGIMKHTSLFYKNGKKLDYGFEYITSGLTQNKKIYEIKYNILKTTFESLIVAYADEIAQISSDYIDLCSIKGDGQVRKTLDKVYPYCDIKEENPVKRAQKAIEELIECFINDYFKNKSFRQLKNGKLKEAIDDFNEVRKNILKSNSTIIAHDKIKEAYIKELYSYYFNNPTKAIGLLTDFYNRIKYIKLNEYVLNEINELDAKSLDALHEYVKKVFLEITSGKDNEIVKNYKTIYKMYIRSVAVYISKMTDSYADHKIDKIIK